MRRSRGPGARIRTTGEAATFLAPAGFAVFAALAGLTGVLGLTGCAGSRTDAPGPEGTPRAAPSERPLPDDLDFPPLEFQPPEPERFELSNGVTVFLLEDRALPLVEVLARFRGGSSHFDRSFYGAASALAGLLRTGGTATLPPDSVDALVEFYALNLGFGSGGTTSFANLEVLQRHLPLAVELWSDLVRRPRFDPSRVEVWRGQELERVRRRRDSPGYFAISEFNRVMYGDHPVGWILDEEDLTPERLAIDRLRHVHRSIYCPGNLILGVTGSVSRAEVTPLLEDALASWAPCPAELRKPSPPATRNRRGVYFIQRALEQSTVYMGHAGGISQADDADYFASRIANAILGASGFTSRLMREVRGSRGYAYGVSSFWTAPLEHQGTFGATTATRSETTIAAIRLIMALVDEMRAAPPTEEEVRTAIDDIVNGFVFNFESPSQVVSRQMLYHAEDMPADWLERYMHGIQAVTPADVHRVMRRHVHPENLTVLILGDGARLDEPPSVLGEVTEIEVERSR